MTRLSYPRLAAVVAAASLTALAPSAGAQVVERDHRKAPPPSDRRPTPPERPADRPSRTVVIPYRVDGFEPTRGRAGARVVIKGNGFTRTTSVVVGGRPVRPLSWTATEIAFVVPNVPGDVEIALRKPGSTDLPVGTFDIVGPLVIQRLAPAAGATGTRVEILGSGFEKSDVLTMNGRPLPVTEWTPDKMTTVIPEGAATDYISVNRPSGEKARSPQRFRVVAEAPSIARFSPETGPPGTRVRLTGSGFTASDRVLYGYAPAPVLGRGVGWVDVEVPRRAARSEHFTVRGRTGFGRSSTAFTLDLPPEIAGFAPTRGAPGTQIEIRGKNFREGDWVSLAGKRLPIVRVEPRSIRATIPIGSESGAIAVGRDRYEAPARGRFEVFNPPALSAFTPTRGEPGTRVTLTGSHLADVEAYYGKVRIPVLSRRGDTSVVVEVPRAARDDRFRVISRAGSAESAQVFQVQYYTVIENARPRAAVPGATVVLTGRHLDKADDFYLGSNRFELVARDNNSATVKVPDGARSAPVAWTTFGRRSETSWRFDVLAGPVISQFQPTSGPIGTEIIIRGDHIDRRTTAFFGRKPLRVARVTPPYEIVVVLPEGAGGSDYLYLEGLGARARSEQPFEVKVAPFVMAVEPTAGRPGQQVTVRGKWFSDATEILIGKVRSRVVRRDERGGAILIEVPRGAPPGPQVLSAKNETMISEFKRPFVVLSAASITGFSPDRARWGQEVRVDGTALDRGVRVWFGSVELPIVRRGPNGTQIWVIVPDSARGTSPVEIDDGTSERQRARGQLTIEEPSGAPPPPPPPRVRDHRTKPPAPNKPR